MEQLLEHPPSDHSPEGALLALAPGPRPSGLGALGQRPLRGRAQRRPIEGGAVIDAQRIEPGAPGRTQAIAAIAGPIGSAGGGTLAGIERLLGRGDRRLPPLLAAEPAPERAGKIEIAGAAAADPPVPVGEKGDHPPGAGAVRETQR